VKKQPVQGQDLTEPHANSNTKKELLKRARQLGVVGRSGMTKAQLVEAIAREIDESSATSSASHSSSLAPAQHEAESAAQQVREAVWKTAACHEQRNQ
jgi:ATPase subunit of ABC transporter with duplicated ATPase domains